VSCNRVTCINVITNIQSLTKVWKPLNNFCKNENIKKRKIRFDLSKKLPFDTILIIPHPQLWRDKRRLKILNWTKGHGGSFERSFDNKHTPKISSHYDTPIQNGGRSNAAKFHALSVI